MKQSFKHNLKKVPAILAITFFAFLMNAIPQAQAAVPQTLSYQGVLKDSTGNYLTGSYSMVFKIYSASTGGTALWTETQPAVAANSGKFSVTLGSVTALNLAFDADYWLSLKVGTDAEMSPRTKLTSVGYSYTAQIANDVVGGKFLRPDHDALSHKNILGVKENTLSIAKTNFKVDTLTMASANSFGAMILDTFSDSTGIDTANSSGYQRRGSANYDIIAMTHTAEQTFATTGTEYQGLLQLNTDWYYLGQGFKPSVTDVLSKVDLYLARSGTLTGNNIWVEIRTDSGGVPSGTVVQDGTSQMVAASSVSTSALGWVSFTFSTNPNLTANTQYHIVLRGDYTTSSSNFIWWSRLGEGGYSNGQASRSNSSVSWSSIAGDHQFKTYKLGAGGTANVRSIAYTEPVVPTEAMVIADETLGTGSITYSVSRDNGTTWTTCAKETVTSISSQPSGTQLKWKAVITGNAELNGIAVAV